MKNDRRTVAERRELTIMFEVLGMDCEWSFFFAGLGLYTIFAGLFHWAFDGRETASPSYSAFPSLQIGGFGAIFLRHERAWMLGILKSACVFFSFSPFLDR
jgi:hypothetical protein